jgi:hypothetical protein
LRCWQIIDKLTILKKEEKEAEVDVSTLAKDDFTPEKLILV